MFDERDLPRALGSADEAFRQNFDKTIQELQNNGATRYAKAVRLPRAFAILTACLMLTISGYGVFRIFARPFEPERVEQVEQVDLGASWVITNHPEEENPDDTNDGREFYSGIYCADYGSSERWRASAELAPALRELLLAEVFYADGSPANVLAQDPETGECYVDTQGEALFTAQGEEIFSIHYRDMKDGEPTRLMMITQAEEEASIAREWAGYDYIAAAEQLLEAHRKADVEITEELKERTYQEEKERMGEEVLYKRTTDYQEAQTLLGAEFRLPGVMTDLLGEPEFKYQGPMPTLDEYRRAVYVAYSGGPGLYYFAETLRGEDDLARDWNAPGAMIEKWKIKGIELYKIVNKASLRYTWRQDDMVYMVVIHDEYENAMPEQDVLRIILSMNV